MPSHRLRIAALFVGVAVLLAACAGGNGDVSESKGTSSGGGREWVFVDGSGKETKLDEAPQRIVAHGSAAAALIPLGIRPVGIYADSAVEDDLALEHLDLDGIEIVGQEWGVINVEAVAALRPDLIIAEWWPVEEAYSGLEEGTGAASQRLLEIAPVVGIAQGPSVVEMIEDYEALAASLGADLAAPEVVSARERFQEARDRFQKAAETKSGLTALAVSPTVDALYVAVPEFSAELSDFVDWGLNIVVPDTPDEGFEYWETLSWENADKYQADLILIDERSYPSNLEEADNHPTWAFLEAAAADAVAVWPAYWLRNHIHYAQALEQLTTAIDSADEDLSS